MSGLFRGIVRALQIRFTPTGNIVSSDVQSAVAELDSKTVKNSGNENIAGSKSFTNTTTVVGLQLNGSAGNNRDIYYSTSGTPRWRLRLNNAAESGSNSGSNFQIITADDSGNQIDIPLSIVRAANGAITLARPVAFADTTASASIGTGCATFAGGIGANGVNSTFLAINSSVTTYSPPIRANIAAYGQPTVELRDPIDPTNNPGLRFNISAIRSAEIGFSSGSATNISFRNFSTGGLTFAVEGTLNVNGNVTGTQFRLSALNTAPATASSTGTVGEIRWANGFVYLCVATNVWQRAALTTW